MAAGRSLMVGRRRRADDEAEDEEGSVMVEDSQSEGSLLTDLDDDEDGEDSGADGVAQKGGRPASQEKPEALTAPEMEALAKKPRKGKKKGKKHGKKAVQEPAQTSQNVFKNTTDTEAMLNGLKIEDQACDDNVVQFEDMSRQGATQTEAPAITSENATLSDTVETSATAQPRRDHEGPRSKRDAGVGLLPTRGNYFMHDTRTHGGPGGTSARATWNGRGRGRGGANIGGPFSISSQMPLADKPAEQQWKHDLHDTINEEPIASVPIRYVDADNDREISAQLFPKPAASAQAQPQKPLSFSTTTTVGKVSIRVLLQGMQKAVVFAEVPWKHYTRLPDHRPPLRRDKPVRISMPEHAQRYIFPSVERSFVFIPRQMRPNQQGFGRSGYQRSVGGYGYSSRRTSTYGGSAYAPSVAASRRSSFASVARETAFSPVGSYAGGMHPRPVVRLPHGSQSQFPASTPSGPLSGHQTPTGMGVHTFPLPQQPIHQAYAPMTTMHQPRPQKTISVTGIESPAVLHSPDSQPFQSQLPAHMHEQMAPYNHHPPSWQSPGQQYGFSHQTQAGTPLSGIPEQAVQAAPFQPQVPYGQPYYPPYPPQQGYYYPPPAYQSMGMYMPPPQHQNYMMSPPRAPMPPPPQGSSQPERDSEGQQQHSQHQSQPQSGMVAQEHNGMVFYIPASEAQHQAQGGENGYQPAENFVPSYAMPGLPPPTPAPDTTYYYSSTPGVQMNDSAVYYSQ